MTGSGQPRTCSHPIKAQTLTGVCQVVRISFPCLFQVFVSIGSIESDFIFSKCPKWNQEDIILLRLYSTSAEGL